MRPSPFQGINFLFIMASNVAKKHALSAGLSLQQGSVELYGRPNASALKHSQH